MQIFNMVTPRGVGGPAPIFALAIFRPFLIEPLLRGQISIMERVGRGKVRDPTSEFKGVHLT